LQHGFFVEQNRSIRKSFDLHGTEDGFTFFVEVRPSVFHAELKFRHLILWAIGEGNIISSWVFWNGDVLDADIDTLCSYFRFAIGYFKLYNIFRFRKISSIFPNRFLLGGAIGVASFAIVATSK